MRPLALGAVPGNFGANPGDHLERASGLFPDAVDPRWTLVDEGGGSPSFAGGVLTISTPVNSFSARQFYTMRNEGGCRSRLLRLAPYWLEAEMRFVSGNQTSGWWRALAT